MRKRRTRLLIDYGLLIAIEALFCFTPLGSLPAVGPIVATLAMIPVLIAAEVFGPAAGSLLGLAAGTFSFLVWTFTPPSPLVAFVFTPFYSLGTYSGNFGSVLICFGPRILAGLAAGRLAQRFEKAARPGAAWPLAAAAAAGSLVNTFGVLGGIGLFFGAQYSSLAGQGFLLLAGLTVLTSGIPEAAVAAIAVPFAAKALRKIQADR